MSNLDKELDKILVEGVRKVFTLVQFPESQSSIDANIIAQTGNITQMQSFLGKNIGKQSVAQIKSTIKEALVSEMPKGYVGRDLDYKYIYYNKALSDCLEVIKKVLGG